MATTFKVGDVVRLKSGGPSMTIDEVSAPDGELSIWCIWFDKGTQKGAGFKPEVLLADSGPTIA
ncbi:YodC family protein [Mesorhizobium amorphae]|uniref:YodC family protein n=1 Tax=Mesorhizobium amorphae TaxID=71433 RepID=UPI00178656F8|nr:DUF2158 domain-containing protein [Mesorhizobium amorphae]